MCRNVPEDGSKRRQSSSTDNTFADVLRTASLEQGVGYLSLNKTPSFLEAMRETTPATTGAGDPFDSWKFYGMLNAANSSSSVGSTSILQQPLAPPPQPLAQHPQPLAQHPQALHGSFSGTLPVSMGNLPRSMSSGFAGATRPLFTSTTADSETSIGSSPALWTNPPSDDTQTSMFLSTSAGKLSRFFPSPATEHRPPTLGGSEMTTRSNSIDTPLDLSFIQPPLFEEPNLGPSQKSAHMAAASVLNDPPTRPDEPTAEEVNKFIHNREHPPYLESRRWNEDDVEEPPSSSSSSSSSPSYPLSVPKLPTHQEASLDRDIHSSITDYIRTIITHQHTQYMIYIASLPYDTPVSQCYSLIRQAFRNFGEITHMAKDEHSKSPKVSLENDLFVRFRIVTKLFDDQKLPYKSHRFFNEVTGRDSKMLLFFDCPSSSPTGQNDQGGNVGYSKLDLSSYPEGFASTFHRRGVSNFMFVRELQSKMIINRSRSNGGAILESAEFRISLPVEELNLGQSHESNWDEDDYRRIKRSYVVSIDLYELDNRPVPHKEERRYHGRKDRRR